MAFTKNLITLFLMSRGFKKFFSLNVFSYMGGGFISFRNRFFKKNGSGTLMNGGEPAERA